jgi:hypothetical protein
VHMICATINLRPVLDSLWQAGFKSEA